MLVVDASAWVDLFLDRLPVVAAAHVADEACLVPPHTDFEVGAALARLERRGEIATGASRAFIGAFQASTVERQWNPGDAVAAMDLLSNATYGDALYLAMAQRLDCPLLTTDSGLATAAGIVGVTLSPRH